MTYKSIKKQSRESLLKGLKNEINHLYHGHAKLFKINLIILKERTLWYKTEEVYRTLIKFKRTCIMQRVNYLMHLNLKKVSLTEEKNSLQNIA